MESQNMKGILLQNLHCHVFKGKLPTRVKKRIPVHQFNYNKNNIMIIIKETNEMTVSKEPKDHTT